MAAISRAPSRELLQVASVLHAARLHPASFAAATTTAGGVRGAAAAAQASHARSHQRRHSSSKPSSPADGAKVPPPQDGSSSASAASSATPTPSAPPSASPTGSAAPSKDAPASRKRSPSRAAASRAPSSGKARGGRAARSAPRWDAQSAALPSVPSTQHLDSSAVNLASFFSLHRPMSLTSPVPPLSSSDAFAALFRSKSSGPSDAAEDEVSLTLSAAVRVLDRAIGAAAGGGEEQHQQGADGKGVSDDLDGRVVRVSLQELASSLRPFQPPPPPPAVSVPVPQFSEEGSNWAAADQSGLRESAQKEQGSRTRSTMRERRASGMALRAKARAQVLQSAAGELATRYNASRSRARREGLRARARARAEGIVVAARERPAMGEAASSVRWQALSTRRRRQLRMKKHKHRKLLKRQKNEKRRLDRL